MAERTVTIRAVLEDRLTKPLSVARKGFQGVRQGIQEIGRQVGPLTTKLTALATALTATAVSRRSLDLAREQVQAEKGLLAALNGRVTAAEHLLQVTAQIQSQTEIGDEVLLRQAALLANMGVSAEQIPRALQASVDTAAALGLELEGASKGVGLALSVGRAGELGERIGELAQLQKEGRLATEVLDVLEAKFKGQAAAQAQTIFGRITQEQNLLGDALERVGSILATVYLPALEQARKITEDLVDVVDAPEFEAFAEFIRQNAAQVTRWAAALAGVGVGIGVIAGLGAVLAGVKTTLAIVVALFGTLGSALVAIAGAAGAFFAALAAWPVVIAAIVAGFLAFLGILDEVLAIAHFLLTWQRRLVEDILKATGGSERLAKAWDAIREVGERFLGDVREVLGRIGQGELAIDDLFELLTVRFLQLRALVDAAFEQATGAWETLKEVGSDVLTILAGTMKVAVLSSVKFGRGRAFEFFEFLARGFDFVLNGISSTLKLVGFEIESNAVGSVRKIRNEVSGAFNFETTLAQAAADVRAGFERIEDAPRRFAARRVQAIEDAARRIRDLERSLQFELEASSEELADERILANQRVLAEELIRASAIREEEEALRRGLGEIRQEAGSLFEDLDVAKIEALVRSINESARGGLETSIGNELERAFQAGEISSQQFFERQRALALTLVQDQERAAVALVEQRVSEVEQLREAAALREQELQVASTLLLLAREEGATRAEEAELAGQVRDAKTAEVDAQAAIASQLRLLIQAEEERNRLLFERVQTEQDLEGLRIGLADRLVSEAEEARVQLEAERQRMAEQLAEGIATSSEVAEADAEALEIFRAKLAGIRGELEEIAQKAPGAAAELAGVREQIQSIEEDGEELGDSAGGDSAGGGKGYFESMRLGAKHLADEMSNLEKAGAKAGATLARELAQGVIDVFITGKKTLKEFLGQFLLMIAQMIVQLVVYKAIATALGLPGTLADPNTANAATGGLITERGSVRKFAAGGEVPGPRVRRDIVPARLMPGEYVLPVSSVDYYGVGFMSALRRRAIPKTAFSGMPSFGGEAVIGRQTFATGGSVAQASSAAFQAEGEGNIQRSVLVANEETMEALIAGGEGALLEFMRTHAGELRGAGDLSG